MLKCEGHIGLVRPVSKKMKRLIWSITKTLREAFDTMNTAPVSARSLKVLPVLSPRPVSRMKRGL